MPTTWYHGTDVNLVKFSDEFLGRENAPYGPGIYLTNNPELAHAHGKNLYEVTIDNLKLVKTSPSKLPTSKIQDLIKQAPDYRDNLYNWGEDEQASMYKAIADMLNGKSAWDILQNIWYEFYKEETTQFVRNASAMGFDGAVLDRGKSIIFLILMNPKKVISVKQVS